MATFTDFNNSFAFLPSTGDLALKKEADSVKQSIKNLVLTDKGERLMQPDIGCKIRSLLFENFTPQTSIVARQTIEETIQQFEPRAQLINIQISASPDSNYMFVSILFNLINNKDEQVLNLELARIR
tara:strand:+ start:739 stop:1119 length:381 start_codon:yes stop_codon:yes gene_type:complete